MQYVNQGGWEALLYMQGIQVQLLGGGQSSQIYTFQLNITQHPVCTVSPGCVNSWDTCPVCRGLLKLEGGTQEVWGISIASGG